MNREEVFYLAPYILSLIISLGIFIYTWQHRQVRGAGIYTFFAAGQTLTILGFIIELLSPGLQAKIFWDKFQWLTDTFLVILPFLIFSIHFSEHKMRHPVVFWMFIAAFLLVFTIIFFTDDIHHLIYPNPSLSVDYPFPELKYGFTYIVYFYSIFYLYGTNFYGVVLLLRRAFQPYNLYRSQYLIIAGGFSVTLILSIFSLLNIKIAPQRDITPISFALGNLIVAWGVFRYKLFDIVPIARGRIIENMNDPVVVLDISYRIVDINKAALILINKKASEVIGNLPSLIFAEWPAIAKIFENPKEQRVEISADYESDTISFDISLTAMLNSTGGPIGTIMVMRDITRHKMLEAGYRMLSEELEQRVRERTKELDESTERYRAVVENQTEFIVRWKPDRTRTFVNNAYCRYFGLSMKQAMGTDFFSLIVEDDRHLVEEKTARLLSGASIVETEVHRAIKPDGSIAWQEWTDQAIRDESGQVVEFQSVGRDITAHKNAEFALRQSEERFSKAFQESPVVITIFGLDDGKLIEVNEVFETISGYTREEAVGKSTIELGLWPKSEERERLIEVLLTNGRVRKAEIQLRTKNGNILTCLCSAELIDINGEKCGIAVVEDITERIKAEARILRLNRLYITISQINQTIVHAQDKNGLFQKICQVAIEHGQFCMAWIGVNDDAGEVVSPIVFAGEEAGYLENININLKSKTRGQGPTGTAIREGRCVICQDIASDPCMIPWRDAALSHGFRSSAAVPLREQGRVFGALTVYAGEPQGFDAEDEGLLEQIGLDVSFAVDSIDAEVKRKRAEENLEEAYDTTLEGWAKALELRDKETEGHSRRVTKTTLVVAQSMGFGEAELIDIRRGSILHDIGKMGIPDDVLRKDGPLSDSERQIVMKHPIIAYDLLKRIPYLEKALEIPYCHHEKWNGSGYPQGLKGTEIPLSARIFAVVDVWDALTSDRPYRMAWPRDKVIQYLLDETGIHFDSKVVDVFLELLREGKI